MVTRARLRLRDSASVTDALLPQFNSPRFPSRPWQTRQHINRTSTTWRQQRGGVGPGRPSEGQLIAKENGGWQKTDGNRQCRFSLEVNESIERPLTATYQRSGRCRFSLEVKENGRTLNRGVVDVDSVTENKGKAVDSRHLVERK
ncbi:hypothetical protein VF21_09807 [Pseudogymnoascus sp. 05NY08]|nr:hypothetical protein VF21_09807 [Pseudogymnoascus sp. 05NY08]